MWYKIALPHQYVHDQIFFFFFRKSPQKGKSETLAAGATQRDLGKAKTIGKTCSFEQNPKTFKETVYEV